LTTLFKSGILGWVLGDHSAETFASLWELVEVWKCYFYVTDGWPVYPCFIPDGDQIISKIYMTSSPRRKLRYYYWVTDKEINIGYRRKSDAPISPQRAEIGRKRTRAAKKSDKSSYNGATNSLKSKDSVAGG